MALVLKLLKIALPVPAHTTFCRRRRRLAGNGEPYFAPTPTLSGGRHARYFFEWPVESSFGLIADLHRIVAMFAVLRASSPAANCIRHCVRYCIGG
jgi:hypothetical protein